MDRAQLTMAAGTIKTHKDLWGRITQDPTLEDAYAQALQRGDIFPPIDVFIVGKKATPYVVDGHHRLGAYRQQGRKQIPVTRHIGTMAEAEMFALKANAMNGKRLSARDRRRAIKHLLKLDSELTQVDLAKTLGVSRMTIHSDLKYDRKAQAEKENDERKCKNFTPPAPASQSVVVEQVNGLSHATLPSGFTREQVAEAMELAGDDGMVQVPDGEGVRAKGYMKEIESEAATLPGMSPVEPVEKPAENSIALPWDANDHPWPEEMHEVMTVNRDELKGVIVQITDAWTAYQRFIFRIPEGIKRAKLEAPQVNSAFRNIMRSLQDRSLPMGPCPTCSGSGCPTCAGGGWAPREILSRKWHDEVSDHLWVKDNAPLE